MRRCSRLWDLTKPPTEAIRGILDLIGTVLVDGTNTCPTGSGPPVELPGHLSFQTPLANADGTTSACMLIDEEAIQIGVALLQVLEYLGEVYRVIEMGGR